VLSLRVRRRQRVRPADSKHSRGHVGGGNWPPGLAALLLSWLQASTAPAPNAVAECGSSASYAGAAVPLQPGAGVVCLFTSSVCTSTPPPPLFSSARLSVFEDCRRTANFRPTSYAPASNRPPACPLSLPPHRRPLCPSSSRHTPGSSAKRSGALETLVRLNCSTSPSHHHLCARASTLVCLHSNTRPLRCMRGLP
jgi:hypothetical protein